MGHYLTQKMSMQYMVSAESICYQDGGSVLINDGTSYLLSLLCYAILNPDSIQG